MLFGPSRSFCYLRSQHCRRVLLARDKSSWVPSKKRSPVARRRPLRNGEVVPFHVNELCQLQPKFINIQARQRPTSEVTRSYESDLIVVLDMDECLLHSKISGGKEGSSLAYQQRQQQHSNTEDSTVESFRIHLPIPSGDLFADVHLRPGVFDFLERITSQYETHIFTAATKVYANPVLDHISSSISSSNSDIFTSRWFREDCTWDPNHQVFIKDLSKLPLELHRTVLVDNNPLSFLSQPDNGIWVNSFFTDGNDATLEAVHKLISEDLHDVEDVRPVLAERFQLAQQLALLDSTAAPLQQTMSATS